MKDTVSHIALKTLKDLGMDTDIILRGFETSNEIEEFKKNIPIEASNILYEGPLENINKENLENIVERDDERFFKDTFKQNELHRKGLIMEGEISRFYKDYKKNDFSIEGDPELSFLSAYNSLSINKHVIVYLRRRKVSKREL